MSVAPLEDVRIAYDDSGGEGPVVLLTHGFLMDRSMFEPQVAALAPTHRVITWDQRGFGDTEYDGEAFDYWTSARDGLALLDHLGIEAAVVGGMSQGGFVSLRMALLAPQRVRALLLFDTQAGPEDPAVVPVYQGMIDQWLAEGPTEDLAAATAAIILGDPVLDERWKATWRSRPHESLRQPGVTLLSREDITDRLGEIEAPALVVHGTADAAIPMEKAERLCDGLPGCNGVVAIEGGTHAANLTHPEDVNGAVLAFLAALPELGAPHAAP